MERTTLLLPPELRDRASRLARSQGRSLADLIREQLQAAVGAAPVGDPWLADTALAGGPPVTVTEAPVLASGTWFVAADALVARHWAGHPAHARLGRAWAAVAVQRPPLVTTPHEIASALTTITRPTSAAFAAERGRRLAEARLLTVEVPSPDDHHQACAWLARFQAPEADFATCLAFAVAHRQRVVGVLTAQEPYHWAGFALGPA